MVLLLLMRRGVLLYRVCSMACILRNRFCRPAKPNFVRYDLLPALRGIQSKNFDAEIPPPVGTGKQFANPMLNRSDSRSDNVVGTTPGSKQAPLLFRGFSDA